MKAERTYMKAFISRLKNKDLGQLEVIVLEPSDATNKKISLQEWYGFWKWYGVDLYEINS